MNPNWPTVAIASIGLLTIIVQNVYADRARKRSGLELQAIKKRGDDNHALLNSSTRIDKVTIVTLTRRLAEGGAVADIEALRSAEQVLRDYDTKQAVANGVAAGMLKAQVEQ